MGAEGGVGGDCEGAEVPPKGFVLAGGGAAGLELGSVKGEAEPAGGGLCGGLAGASSQGLAAGGWMPPAWAGATPSKQLTAATDVSRRKPSRVAVAFILPAVGVDKAPWGAL